MLIDYWQFARAHRRFLAFGFLMAFLSSPGQTFFIGVFGAEIQAQFGLDSASWGRSYMLGTLLSAALISWSGSLIDRFDLRWFSGISLFGLSLACLAMALVPTPVLLIGVVFLLRQFGQGLTSHSSITSMARYHASDRGKAIALAAIGFSSGEALLPLLASYSIRLWGWRETYAITALLVLLSILLVMWLLKGHGARHAALDEQYRLAQQKGVVNTGHTRRQMLSEPRFYLMLPAMMAPSMIMTALFFFPNALADSKGWSALWVTGNYWLYSFTAVVVSIYSGVLIDRFGARRVVPGFLFPLTCALASLSLSNHTYLIWPYMLLMGISSGFYFTGLSSLWAELYGPKHLGAIKSLTNAVMVFSSALGPALVGYGLSLGIPFPTLALLLAGFCLVATALLVYALRPNS